MAITGYPYRIQTHHPDNVGDSSWRAVDNPSSKTWNSFDPSSPFAGRKSAETCAKAMAEDPAWERWPLRVINTETQTVLWEKDKPQKDKPQSEKYMYKIQVRASGEWRELRPTWTTYHAGFRCNLPFHYSADAIACAKEMVEAHYSWGKNVRVVDTSEIVL